MEWTYHYGSDARVFTPTEKVINRVLLYFTSSHHRTLDQGDQTGTRPAALQARATDQDHSIAFSIHEQEVSQRIGKPAPSLFRKWNDISVRATDGNWHPTITTQGSPFGTTPNDSGGILCDTVGWTHWSLQDLLANRSMMLVARNEPRHTQGSIGMRVLQSEKHSKSSSTIDHGSNLDGQSLRHDKYGYLVSRIDKD